MSNKQISPEGLELEERIVQINRVSKVVKGGRRFSFSAIVVVGDKKGQVGVGLGKAGEVPEAIKKAGKQAKKRAMDAYHKRYPMTYAAHVITRNAARDGTLIKPNNCSVCGSTEKIEGHHDDYSKPLEVRWLCSKCHKEWHKINGSALNG